MLLWNRCSVVRHRYSQSLIRYWLGRDINGRREGWAATIGLLSQYALCPQSVPSSYLQWLLEHPFGKGEATESPSMCLDSPRDKRHWSPQDMVKWGQEKHNTRDGETLALQQRNHRRPLTITKHFTKRCRKRDLVNTVWHMGQYEYSLSGHAVCWPPPEPF